MNDVNVKNALIYISNDQFPNEIIDQIENIIERLIEPFREVVIYQLDMDDNDIILDISAPSELLNDIVRYLQEQQYNVFVTTNQDDIFENIKFIVYANSIYVNAILQMFANAYITIENYSYHHDDVKKITGVVYNTSVDNVINMISNISNSITINQIIGYNDNTEIVDTIVFLARTNKVNAQIITSLFDKNDVDATIYLRPYKKSTLIDGIVYNSSESELKKILRQFDENVVIMSIVN